MKTTAVLAAIALLAACGEEPAITETTETAEVRGLSTAQQRDLALARASTARFHRFSVAYDDADYTLLFMDMCMDSPEGGMGFHYVNTDLLDAELDVRRPEALMYEPGPDGQLRLVGLEYVVPQGDWTSPNPPRLFGRDFTPNQFGLWALHVWIWKHNPDTENGIFADWNPNVSCANAAQVPHARAH